MLAPTRFVLMVSWVALGSACRKAPPVPQATEPAPSARASVALPATAASAPPAPVASAKPAAPTPPLGKPAPLDAAGLKVAKTYLAELAQGRKATVAKDFAAAEEHFSKCLEALPKDPRALGERGYARLLAGKPAEAETDLAAATRGAPSSGVLVQILHNRMLAARQRGDESAAQSFEAQKKQLKAARRLPNGVTCDSDVVDSDVEPQVSKTLDEALSKLLAAHAAEDGVERSAVSFNAGPRVESNVADELRTQAARGPLADGGWELWSFANSPRNHALIAHAGVLYGFPNQSSGYLALCGLDDAAELTMGGGGTQPLYIQRSYRQVVRGYNTDEASGQTMGFCTWVSSSIDLTILDSKTLRGIRTVRVAAHPSDENGSAQEPERLLELEWQADKVVVEACGKRSVVPYAPE